ncbi:uncharacterized protein LOC144884890 isoform X1 [Branchiostoma floridae x Branchiostoma japonicum]
MSPNDFRENSAILHHTREIVRKQKTELEDEGGNNTCMGQGISCVPVPKRRRRPTVCITACSTTTLFAVENLVRAALGESINIDIHTVHIQKRESISLLKKYGSKTYFVCCANYGHRLLLLSDTDPDELTEVVYHAGKISKYKKDGVMVLLFGHRNLTEGVYDLSTFDGAFMRSQPRLGEKAGRGKFISVYDTFNSDQEECLRRWVRIPTEKDEALGEEPMLMGPTENVEASEEDPFLDKVHENPPLLEPENINEARKEYPRTLQILEIDPHGYNDEYDGPVSTV